VDLNPRSRTAEAAHITIVDNLVRTMPALVEQARMLRGRDRKSLARIVKGFNNRKNLAQSLRIIRSRA
jgi:4-phosphopantoate--beta-alanine ligase